MITTDAIWVDDLLGRKEEASSLINFLARRHQEHVNEGRKHSYVINLDGAWGQGKTFFVDRLAQQLKAEGYLTATVNAWRDDSGGEPIVAVMAAIEDALKPLFKNTRDLDKAWKMAKAAGGHVAIALAKGAAKNLVSKFVGDGVDEAQVVLERLDIDTPLLFDDISGDKFAEDAGERISTLLDRVLTKKLEAYNRNMESVVAFKRRLSTLLKSANNGEIAKPCYVIIDELDRCRPTYAIELLEQIKHLFDIPEIIFIVSTDHDQLSNAIGAVYGEKFDGNSYLKRFFSRKYTLPSRNLRQFTNYLFDSTKLDQSKCSSPMHSSPVDFFSDAMRFFDCSLRDTEQCFDILRSICTVWDNSVQIQLLYMIPMIVFFQNGEADAMEELNRSSGTIPRLTNTKNWTVPVTDAFSHRQSASGQKEIKVVEMINRMRVALEKPLPDLIEQTTSDLISNWLQQQFIDEFGKLHGNSYSQRNPPHSIIRTYPDRIRSIGTLTITR